MGKPDQNKKILGLISKKKEMGGAMGGGKSVTLGASERCTTTTSTCPHYCGSVQRLGLFCKEENKLHRPGRFEGVMCRKGGVLPLKPPEPIGVAYTSGLDSRETSKGLGSGW